jgi:hypothetical protein
MKTRLLLTTAVGLVFATAAFAQSPKDAQTQTPSTTAPASQKAPDTSSRQTPANSSSTTAPSTTGGSQAQTTPSTPQPGGTSAPAQAQTSAPPASNNQAQQAPASGSPTTAQQPAQSGNPPTNTAQQPAQSANPPTNTAQQPAQPANSPTNTAQSSSNANASVQINDQQRTRVTQAISRLNVQPVTNVNFSLSVGTVVPRDVRLQTLPADVVEVVPQYRGYSFFAVRDEIVIVEPSTSKIVTVLPRSGGNTAAASAPSRSKAAFTDRDRDVVRKHVKARTERQTTGSTAKTVIRRGERLPDSVEVEEFPETVYREAPALREYRYLHRDDHTYIVDPTERTVIEDFD